MVRGNVDVGDLVRGITIVQKEHFEADAILNPDWINLIEDLRQLRFMDWQETNNSMQNAWVDCP
ncbi:hypothetical protein [uncultured Sulfitobacter sp.]|uniref:hypothetical protein n=1 Tax=uncultured Sulfitobacter sp. TaxID=191468 RepID=UPI0026307B89|nr:hypothetical protein [uncultured Sulfitobacter sp.]